MKRGRTLKNIILNLSYMFQGVYIGSCIYTDICLLISFLFPQFNPDECLPEVAQYGIDCTCPLGFSAGNFVYNHQLSVPEFSTTIFSFMASGDYDLTLKAKDNLGPMFCTQFKFTMRPAPYGK